ncbi:hypothetical protein E3N88_28748 [Mikania micrantha]|uniref:Reverse transcriptase Ty1/copia-type domain-containing protein n=1 Tax=Mikania micrantha TaxID=192012 RepID=A0A5N6N1H3_9ASTR|nr:hypothetical protein E3N88_28748 [Mikania micrantha]
MPSSSIPSHIPVTISSDMADRNESDTSHSNYEPTGPDPTNPNHEPPLLRRSSRDKQTPAWHNTYFMPSRANHSSPNTSTCKGTRYPLSDHLSFSRFSPSHRIFLGNITAQTEPRSYDEAICHPHWQQAMAAELKALKDNNTWSLVPLPMGHKPIGCRWVYKIKYNSDGTIERYKARLVAKGYTQVEGIDYKETFSPTAKLTTLRCLLTVAAARNWFTHQLDVQNAFLHGDLHEVVYMTPPPGFLQKGDNVVCRLNKSLYGLKQASRNWFSTFSDTVQKAGYTQSKADYSLFTKTQGKSFTAILIYVDDILLTDNDLHEIKLLKECLLKRFHIKDLGDLKYFLGIEFCRSKNGIIMSQRKYAVDILQDSGLMGSRPE